MVRLLAKHHHEPYQAWLGKLQEARGHESQLVERLREIMVMGEIPGGRQTHVLIRGQYDQPGERVSAGTPDSILPFPKIGLPIAWDSTLAGGSRPSLTSRVVVNRFWQMLFGRGLVVTSEDFGSQGHNPVPRAAGLVGSLLHGYGMGCQTAVSSWSPLRHTVGIPLQPLK